MSSIILTPAVTPLVVRLQRTVAVVTESTEPRTRLRITVRGRRVRAALLALPIVGAIVVAILGGGVAFASGQRVAGGGFEAVTVMPGDTLWSIASDVAPFADPRDVVAAIINLNLIANGELAIGQRIAIPTEYVTEK